jgi:hypothetical protein
VSSQKSSKAYREKKKIENSLIENKIQDYEAKNKQLKMKIQNLNNLLRTFNIYKDGLNNNNNNNNNNLNSSQIELNSNLIKSLNDIQIKEQNNSENKQVKFNVPSLLFNDAEKSPIQVINNNDDDDNNNTDSILILKDGFLNLNSFSNELNENNLEMFNLNQTDDNNNNFKDFEYTGIDNFDISSSNWLDDLFENCK